MGLCPVGTIGGHEVERSAPYDDGVRSVDSLGVGANRDRVD